MQGGSGMGRRGRHQLESGSNDASRRGRGFIPAHSGGAVGGGMLREETTGQQSCLHLSHCLSQAISFHPLIWPPPEFCMSPHGHQTSQRDTPSQGFQSMSSLLVTNSSLRGLRQECWPSTIPNAKGRAGDRGQAGDRFSAFQVQPLKSHLSGRGHLWGQSPASAERKPPGPFSQVSGKVSNLFAKCQGSLRRLER